LFKPFSQIDSGLARKFEGTGLGLSMVKSLAELHSGAVAVESAVGTGSCFTVWLPIRAVNQPLTAAVRGPKPRGADPRQSVRTALVVEDDSKAAELIRMHLEAEGFQVIQAASGEAALAISTQQPLALITLDVHLPGMDGWEFLGRIKQVPSLMRVPVVIVSIVDERAKAFALGASAVMHKPMSRQELSESLVELGLLPIANGATLKILVVDDDPTAVELVALHVMALGSSVLRAFSGLDAIELARKELPDLIVLDLMMPDVTGFDVVEELTKHPTTARIPILVVTATQVTAESRATLEGEVSTIIEKTELNRDRFTSEVRRAMAGRKAEA
ncbi:MAG: response regulator, partial [Deltaproteobacteria bacterium]|nr:response regulator [Deltaproteobacteria bacterium]